MNTLQYLDAVKAKRGITSDYELAKVLGVAQPNISSYRSGRRIFDDDMALQVAVELEINPLAVIATANEERSKTPEQKARWRAILEKISASFNNLLSGRTGVERRRMQRLQVSVH